MRSATAAAALAAAFTFFGTCSADAAQVLHRPSEAEPDSLDPQKTTAGEALGMDRDMFIGLVALNGEGQPIPGVASSWDVSPDKKLWTFHLRPEAKWSTGEPVTAEDFVYSFRRLVDPKTAASDYSDLKQVVNAEEIVAGKEKDVTKLGVRAVDAHTLELTLKEPRIVLPLLLTDPMTFPLHRASLEKWGNAWTQPGHLVSNGPYVMKSWTPQAEIVMAKNPLFWDAASVKIDEVHWLVSDDREAAYRRYLAGELDWIGLTRNNLAKAKAEHPGEFHSAPTNFSNFMFFNMTKGPWSKDLRIRKAMSMALDRDVLVQKIDPRGEAASYSIMPTVISNYTRQDYAWKGEPIADRVKEAKALMADAGYSSDHPLEITVSYPTQESTRQILLALHAMWAPIGIDLKMRNMEWQVFENETNNHTIDMGIMGASGTYDDYESGLDNYRSDAGQYNWSAYSNPKFDDLFHRGGTAPDMPTRRSLMEEAERVMLADYPMIPLEEGVINRLVNPKLQGMFLPVYTPQTRYLWFKD